MIPGIMKLVEVGFPASSRLSCVLIERGGFIESSARAISPAKAVQLTGLELLPVMLHSFKVDVV